METPTTIPVFLAQAIATEVATVSGKPMSPTEHNLVAEAAYNVLNRFWGEILRNPHQTYREFLLRGFC